MKKLIFISVVFIILSITWIMYLKHSERSFINSTNQQAPAANQVMKNSAQSFTNNKLSQEKDLMIEKYPSVTDTEHVDSVNKQDVDTSSLTNLLNIEKDLSKEDDSQKTFSEYDSFDTHTEKRLTMSYEEMIAARRKDFIQRFGDTRAVDILLKHLPLFPDTSQENSQNIIILDDHDLNDKFLNDEFAKAVLTLWPTPENQEAYKKMMQMREELLKSKNSHQ